MKEHAIPTFAIIGQPNNGKTTVIATLAEVDSAEISPIPGTTVRCHKYSVMIDGTEVIRFVDTPGFEEVPLVLEWFQNNSGRHPNAAAAFIAEHEAAGLFPRECELLRPIAEDAVAIYVIDGSIPLCEVNKMEMEVLQLVGNPRVAVINSKEADTEAMKTWKPTLNRMFNGYHVFNGHRATFKDRIDLLENIKGQFAPWRSQLETAIAALERDWQSRLNRTADAICDLLFAVMTAKERAPIDAEVENATSKAQKKFREKVQSLEDRYRAEIRKLFRHILTNWKLPPHSLLEEDLFSDRVWKTFGLTKNQLSVITALIWGGVGAAIDAVTGGSSFMLGMLVGASAGAVVGYLGASQGINITVPGLKLGPVSLPDWKVKAGQKYVEASARPESNLPWVLIGRALTYFQLASSWSHGRQERVIELEGEALEFGKSAARHWAKAEREIVATFLKYSNSGANPKKQEAARKALRELFSSLLRQLTARAIPVSNSAGPAESESGEE